MVQGSLLVDNQKVDNQQEGNHMVDVHRPVDTQMVGTPVEDIPVEDMHQVLEGVHMEEGMPLMNIVQEDVQQAHTPNLKTSLCRYSLNHHSCPCHHPFCLSSEFCTKG